MSDSSLLEVRNLRAYYVSKKGIVRAVDDVSFEMRRGECLGILGESGCGKTSLALSIIGLFERMARFSAGISKIPGLVEAYDTRDGDLQDRPGVSGSVRFCGRELIGMDEPELVRIRGRDISMIPQGLTHALNPLFSIGYQTGEPIEVHEEDARRSAIRKRVLEYLDLVQLADANTRYVLDPRNFSGGEAQRILIAMSLISGPRLVIADEPTSALDVTVQRQIMNVLTMIRSEFGVSILMISHDAGVIAELSDRVAVMYAGKIMEIGDARQMFLDPLHPYTAGLMSSFPTIAMMRARIDGRRPVLRGIRGDPPDLADVPSGCPFHPRCDYATEICRSEVPEYREIGPGHWIRCHHR
ncbi:MAG: ABC transporter ATP-binding protein [Candidatus Thorarchaeota archaeon]